MTKPKETKTLLKDHFDKWLNKLKKYRIYGPVQRDNYSEYIEINDPLEINLKIRNTIISPKTVTFQHTKVMFKYHLGSQPPTLEEKLLDMNDSKQVIIGIRPCDVHGILAFDPTFDAEFNDPYYVELRKNTVLVGLACNEPDINCFCGSVEGGPFNNSGMDIMLVDIGDSFIVEILSENGAVLINEGADLFSETSTESTEIDQAVELKTNAESISTRTLDTTGKPEKLGKIFESDYWDAISKKCLGCGICTFLCPTCYCFDITDEKWGQKGERLRSWDSCMYPEYTVHASDYNPRPARMNRLRNRFYHKFKYYPDLYNINGCTGCGRCIRHCPVNIDIIDIINGVDEAYEEVVVNE